MSSIFIYDFLRKEYDPNLILNNLEIFSDKSNPYLLFWLANLLKGISRWQVAYVDAKKIPSHRTSFAIIRKFRGNLVIH